MVGVTMGFILFLLIYIFFRLSILNNISLKILNSLKLENKYRKHMEKKIKQYFDVSFILFLYFISKMIDSALFIKYYDIIPLIYLFYKLVSLYK